MGSDLTSQIQMVIDHMHDLEGKRDEINRALSYVYKDLQRLVLEREAITDDDLK